MRKFSALGAGLLSAASIALSAPAAHADAESILTPICSGVPAQLATLVGQANAASVTHSAAQGAYNEAREDMYAALHAWVGAVDATIQGIIDELTSGELSILQQTATLKEGQLVDAIVAWSQANVGLHNAETALESAQFAVALGNDVQSMICNVVPAP
jgi:hypothetical protein